MWHMLGWGNDNWRETGVSNVNNYLLVHLDVHYTFRLGIQAGTAVRTWLETSLKPRLDDIGWSEDK